MNRPTVEDLLGVTLDSIASHLAADWFARDYVSTNAEARYHARFDVKRRRWQETLRGEWIDDNPKWLVGNAAARRIGRFQRARINADDKRAWVKLAERVAKLHNRTQKPALAIAATFPAMQFPAPTVTA